MRAGSRSLALCAAALAVGLSLPAAAGAAVPVIESSSLAAATETSATLGGMLDPKGAQVKYHFDYVPLAEYELNGFTNAKAAPEADATIPGAVKGKADLLEGSNHLTNLSTSAGTFAPGQALTPITGIPAETTITKVIADSEGNPTELVISKAATATSPQASLTATGAQPVVVALSPLSPATAYRARLVAKNLKAIPEEGIGPEVLFATFAPPPTYGPCPNDLLRSGELAPSGKPGARLPDCRSYEQASPVDKNAGDVLSSVQYAKAAEDGGGVVYGSTFGAPGALGAGELPFYLASRGAGEAGWTSQGLLAPASLGEQSSPLRGWLPDFSASFASATRLGTPSRGALYELHRDGSPPSLVAPYADQFGEPVHTYAGASADGSTVLFESTAKLPPEEGAPPFALAKAGARNLYAWERETGHLSLAGVMNSTGETEALLPKGTYAGPYDWLSGQLRIGGAEFGYYLGAEQAISAEGSVFFTSVSDGQLYERLNPTRPQSEMQAGQCSEAEMACTIHLSASQKTNGQGPNGADPAGAKPAAFMAASTDGATAYFTSSEKLTNDANTGPEQPPAQIGRAELSDPDPNATKVESFLPTHALGVAVDPKGEYVYWAEPALGTIARAKLKEGGAGVEATEASFIEPGETKAITFPKSEPGVYHSAPSAPRYVAVDEDYVYWTNPGPPAGEETSFNAEGGPLEGGGTIGRARIDGSGPEPLQPEFITGATNPQGIAVNETHIYWANAGTSAGTRAIGRATIAGGEVKQSFIKATGGGTKPYGVALSPNHIYYSGNEEGEDNAYIWRFPLDGSGEGIIIGVGKEGVRGLALDAGHVYWAAGGEGAIGRATLNLENREKEFIKPSGSPLGLAVSGTNLYWSVNGEAPPNPGNDLYRYRRAGTGSCAGPGGCLDDLSPDPVGNGAEVQGVVGASEDGSYLYFAANGDLDAAGPAQAGDCHGSPSSGFGGSCNLYRYHEGQLDYIAPLNLAGGVEGSDVLNWTQRPRELNGTATYVEKTSFLSADGRTLLFRSREALTGYDNKNAQGQAVPEYYLYRAGEPLRCVTCNPSGTAPEAGPGLNSTAYPSIGPAAYGASSVPSRHLAAGGDRVFFESTEALVSADSNGLGGCPQVGTTVQFFSACTDVYEWEAPGSGSCTEAGPGWSPLNGGCIYLISTGKSPYPSFFLDASASGSDVFLLSRDSLVGQDTDALQDVYDARVDGGLGAQNPSLQPPCEGEGCLPAAPPPPPYTPAPRFSGPANPAPKRCKAKKCHKHHKHKHKHVRKKHHKHKQHKKRHGATRRGGGR